MKPTAAWALARRSCADRAEAEALYRALLDPTPARIGRRWRGPVAADDRWQQHLQRSRRTGGQQIA